MIKNYMNEPPWPYHKADFLQETFTVPVYLVWFLVGLLTVHHRSKVLGPRIKLLVNPFSQDIVYPVTCRYKKNENHLLFSYAVKTLTRNVKLIHTLIRLGHVISYSQLEENDTALWLQKLAACSDHQAVIPDNIHPYTWGNIDTLEETYSFWKRYNSPS